MIWVVCWTEMTQHTHTFFFKHDVLVNLLVVFWVFECITKEMFNCITTKSNKTLAVMDYLTTGRSIWNVTEDLKWSAGMWSMILGRKAKNMWNRPCGPLCCGAAWRSVKQCKRFGDLKRRAFVLGFKQKLEKIENITCKHFSDDFPDITSIPGGSVHLQHKD